MCKSNVFYCTSTQPGTIPQRSVDLLTPVKINTEFSGGIISAREQRKSEESNSFMKEKEDSWKKQQHWLMIFQNASEVIYFLYKYQKYNLFLRINVLERKYSFWNILRDLHCVEWSCNLNWAAEIFFDT